MHGGQEFFPGPGGSARGSFADRVDTPAFRAELARARAHVAALEAEYRTAVARTRPSTDARHDAGTGHLLGRSPIDRACNAAIWAVIALPVVLGIAALVRRLLFG